MSYILIVEDDMTVNDVIKDVVEKERYRIIQTYNGRDNINLFKYRKPNVIACATMRLQEK